MKQNFKINIRIYGILLHQNRILVSDELIRGNYFTKFPGGGLEVGEGTRDCLKREFKEETNLDVTIGDHIYTTDFFQQSTFNENHQIISIYYFVHTEQIASLKTSSIPFDFSESQKANKTIQAESFRFIAFDELHEDHVSLPIDKIVVKILKSTKQQS
jgi:8-oxo-dGTP diphosphatase